MSYSTLRQAGGVLESVNALSIPHEEAPEADAKAFGRLLAHPKAMDGPHSTIVMVQVEIETSLVRDSREGSVAAEKRFAAPLPVNLLHFLAQDWEIYKST
ncbi:hypothetical protein N7520_008626 [Penicillium odoratum]|uniref:uncharacterized protein n=1 Tax=Penicillium odoratum TaxID=1167516 RepID=UPI0025499473|nr:uncharacterized protein N7520_008626 [Penicillium odoratum]KAJ5751709.1 hypothetical protein N7520_008626 [Penicillium odoratum]